ncbi:hypothetical protein [Pseudomonas monteilii]|nr:hypothetical protein [Pseudomonas monteilii]
MLIDFFWPERTFEGLPLVDGLSFAGAFFLRLVLLGDLRRLAVGM